MPELAEQMILFLVLRNEIDLFFPNFLTHHPYYQNGEFLSPMDLNWSSE